VDEPIDVPDVEPIWQPGGSQVQIFARSLLTEHDWGTETTYGVLVGEFCGKVMTIRMGAAIPDRLHRHKRELLSVLDGRIVFRYRYPGGEPRSAVLESGDCVCVFPGLQHGVTALVDSVLVESSSTEFSDVILVAPD